MWILCGALSIGFCILSWIMIMAKKNSLAYFSSFTSLIFVLTLLMEYKLVANWVNENNMGGIMDVVPTMFTYLMGYVIVMIIANAIPAIIARRK